MHFDIQGFVDLLPPADQLVLLPQEAVGGLLLEFLNQRRLPEPDHRDDILVVKLTNVAADPLAGYAGDRGFEVGRVLAEGWAWLESESLVSRFPGNDRPAHKYFVTRRGRDLRTRSEVAHYRVGREVLPTRNLDRQLAEVAVPLFFLGRYDSAVFEAFKEVEVRVRAAAGAGPDAHGTDLVTDAFKPGGPLSDSTLPKGEQDGVMHLFRGAFAVFRNSSGHRRPAWTADEAAEVVLLANQLLRFVERSRASGA
jgi:uncharacterized protein (TIGR02391 family)